MHGTQGEETRRGTRGARAAKGERRRERRADARLMELMLASRGRMVGLLSAPREVWSRPDHLWAVVSAAEELGGYVLAAPARLTLREVDVFGLQRAGYGSVAIAEKLHIARDTVKTHLKRAGAKVAAARERWRG